MLPAYLVYANLKPDYLDYGQKYSSK